jgi:hypothetical protein
MKKKADKKWPEHSFSVGNLVYMKLQPYVQTSEWCTGLIRSC